MIAPGARVRISPHINASSMWGWRELVLGLHDEFPSSESVNLVFLFNDPNEVGLVIAVTKDRRYVCVLTGHGLGWVEHKEVLSVIGGVSV